MWQAIGAGLGLLGGLFGQNQAKKQLKAQEKADKERMAFLKEQSDRFYKLGLPFMQTGQQNMGLYQNMLRRLASGDRGLMEQQMAPEINMMNEQNRGMLGSMASNYGRGAPMGTGVYDRLQGQIANQMFSLRPQAAAGLGQLGGNQYQLALGTIGQGTGLTNTMLDYGLRARDQMFNQGAAIGAMPFQGAMLGSQLGGMFGGQKSGSLSSTLPNQSNDPFGSWGNFGPYTPRNAANGSPWGSSGNGFMTMTQRNNPYQFP